MKSSKNSPGRPALVPGEIRHKTSVSLTREQQIQFRRMGGSRWLQSLLNAVLKERNA